MAAGDPTGGDLCSGTTNGNTLVEATSWEEREVDLGSGTSVVSGTQYAIVWRAPDGATVAVANTNVHTSNPTANAIFLYSDDSGSTWSQALSTWDAWFKTKSGVTEKDDGSFTSSNSFGFGKTRWHAQTFTAGSSYTLTRVVLKINRAAGISPGTITVSIRNVAGSGPSKATTPSPSDAATNVTLDQATIGWTAGAGATSHNVYYGTTSGNLSLLAGGITDTSYTISGITNGSPFSYVVTRYWRIDEVNAGGVTTGDEWSFTTIRLDPPTETYWYSTGSYYYRLLPQSDGSYGDPPPTGTENVDYEILAGYLPNFINTNRRLVAATRNSIYYEDI